MSGIGRSSLPVRILRPALAVLVTAALLTTGLATPAAAALPTPHGTIARTDKGSVRGVARDGVVEFSGIPYTAPPVGQRRWRPPEPAAAWRGIRDASAPGPACAQSPSFLRPGQPGSEAEDCLYLNVWRPQRAGARLPVLVWFHGGGYTSGAGADYEPVDLAVRGRTLVVTVNYRLASFGFLAHDALNAESADSSSGAYAIQDQQAALRWVRRNARAFGGDPRRVTIAGESAGGAAVCAQLVSPTARGLFHRAIVQSGAGGAGGCATRTADAAAASGRAFAQALGCADPATALACLRARPVADLLRAQQPFGWNPALGGRTMPLDPVTAYGTGRFARVPVLTGTNSDEMTLFVYASTDAAGRPLTAAGYEAAVRDRFGAAADRVLAEYPVTAYPHPASALSAVQTDAGFACGQRRWNRVLAPRVPAYVYEFADPHVPVILTIPPSFPMGAFHGAELFYLWGVQIPQGERTPAQQRLAERMIDHWAAFARTGDPGRADGLRFPRYGTGERVVRLHPDGSTVRTDFGRAHHCGFWDALA